MNEHLVKALLNFFAKDGSDEAKEVYRCLGGNLEDLKPKKAEKKGDKK